VNTRDAARPGSVGRAVPGAIVRVVDDAGHAVPEGQAGHILLGGPTVTRGYHNLPQITQDAFTPEGLFKTGDLGHVDAEGFIYVTGRAKDLIIIAGEKLYPREVEEPLMAYPGVLDAAVISSADDARGETVVAFVVPHDDAELDPQRLKDHLRDAGVAGWKIPRRIVIEKELPRSPTGKVLKRELAGRIAQA
jgi:acyl-CoA synthetase (AMP-forming)/AMP-acid ligase II